jgi:integrase
MTVKRTPSGWKDRVRFGKGRDMRLTISPKLDEAQAEERFTRLRGIAALLVDVPEAEARAVLEEASRADALSLQGIESVARDLARQHAKAKESTKGMTFRELATLWNTGELHKRYPGNKRVKLKASASKDTFKLELMYKAIGDVPLVEFSEDDYYRALALLPTTRSSGTQRHYAQLITKVLNLAVSPVRVIKVSPLPEGILPTPTHRRRPPLRPAEDAALLRCEPIPMLERILYGFLNRNGGRIGEVLQYRGHMFDLDAGAIAVPAEITKDNEARAWALDPDVVRVLRTLEFGPNDLVFPGFDSDHLAEKFRARLQQAGVTRRELFERTATEDWVQIHSTRATFVTVSIANGRSETWVMQRTGHETSKVMRKHYLRMAAHFADLNLGPFLPLDELLGLAHPAHPGMRQGVRQAPNQQKQPKEKSRMNHAGSDGGRERFRTSDPVLVRPYDSSEGSHLQGLSERFEADSDVSVQPGAPGAPSGVRQTDAVEAALARAIDAATADRQWPVVLELAKQLEARRLAKQGPEVTSLDAERARRAKGGHS